MRCNNDYNCLKVKFVSPLKKLLLKLKLIYNKVLFEIWVKC